MKQKIETHVQERVWGPGDTYYIAEVQIDELKFKPGEKVIITVESVEES